MPSGRRANATSINFESPMPYVTLSAAIIKSQDVHTYRIYVSLASLK